MSKIEEILADPQQISTLQREEAEGIIRDVGEIVEGEPALIELPPTGKVVFVGDTHGDLDATIAVVGKYLKNHKLVFLGDYVDRGPMSRENILLLFLLKLARPRDVILLMGNHEAYAIMSFYPADFWGGLDPELRARYSTTLSKLPLVVSSGNGILALHGVPPDVERLSEINGIVPGSRKWRQITWGDLQDQQGEFLGEYVGRPQFGRDYFNKIMSRLGKGILIRSHQPMTPVLYGRRCLTIFTSHAYTPVRSIAIADLEREITTVDDLIVEQI